jgi:hypothetical protein
MAAHEEFDVINLHGKFAVEAIDFHESRIFALEGDNLGRPERLVAEDPTGFTRKLHTKVKGDQGVNDAIEEREGDQTINLLCHKKKGLGL